jgi:hypothetical protein
MFSKCCVYGDSFSLFECSDSPDWLMCLIIYSNGLLLYRNQYIFPKIFYLCFQLKSVPTQISSSSSSSSTSSSSSSSSSSTSSSSSS